VAARGATQVKRLRERAEHVRSVRGAAEAARREARDYFGTRPGLLAEASEAALEPELQAVGEAYDGLVRGRSKLYRKRVEGRRLLGSSSAAGIRRGSGTGIIPTPPRSRGGGFSGARGPLCGEGLTGYGLESVEPPQDPHRTPRFPGLGLGASPRRR
jgi:hypothetical protein